MPLDLPPPPCCRALEKLIGKTLVSDMSVFHLNRARSSLIYSTRFRTSTTSPSAAATLFKERYLPGSNGALDQHDIAYARSADFQGHRSGRRVVVWIHRDVETVNPARTSLHAINPGASILQGRK